MIAFSLLSSVTLNQTLDSAGKSFVFSHSHDHVAILTDRTQIHQLVGHIVL